MVTRACWADIHCNGILVVRPLFPPHLPTIAAIEFHGRRNLPSESNCLKKLDRPNVSTVMPLFNEARMP